MLALDRIGAGLVGGSLVVLGSGTLRDPSGAAAMAHPTLEQLRKLLPLPLDDDALVRLNGAVQTAAGAAVAIGFAPRTSALLLTGSLIPTTYAGHAFWKVQDQTQRSAHRTQFLKNAAIVGGLLVIAGARPGQ